jgi:hypothetical protein
LHIEDGDGFFQRLVAEIHKNLAHSDKDIESAIELAEKAFASVG